MRVRLRASATPRRAKTSIRSRTVIAVTASVALIAAGTGTAAAQTAGPASSGGKTSNVIIVLRNQHTDLTLGRGKAASPRSNAYHADQAPVITRAKSAGAKNLHGFATVNAVAATVTDGAGARWPPTRPSPRSSPTCRSAAPIADAERRRRPRAPSAAADPRPAICPTDPAKPLLEPEALQLTNTAFTDPATPQAQNIVDRRGRQGRLDRRRHRHQQPGLHPGRRPARLRRLPGLLRRRAGRADRRRRGLRRRQLDRRAGPPGLRPAPVRQPGAPAAAGLQHHRPRHGARREPGRAEGVRQLQHRADLALHPGHRLRREHGPTSTC